MLHFDLIHSNNTWNIDDCCEETSRELLTNLRNTDNAAVSKIDNFFKNMAENNKRVSAQLESLDISRFQCDSVEDLLKKDESEIIDEFEKLEEFYENEEMRLVF